MRKSNFISCKYIAHHFYVVDIEKLIRQMYVMFYSIVCNSNMGRICFLCSNSLVYAWSKQMVTGSPLQSSSKAQVPLLSFNNNNFVFCYDMRSHLQSIGKYKKYKWLIYGFLHLDEYITLVDYYFILGSNKFRALYLFHLLLKKFLRLRDAY